MNIILKLSQLGASSRLWLADFSLGLLREPRLRNYSLAVLFFQALNWFFAYGIFRQSQGAQLILHYNIKFGADDIGSAMGVFWLPAVGFATYALNLLASQAIGKRNAFVEHLLLFSAMVFNQVVLAALFSIYLINFR